MFDTAVFHFELTYNNMGFVEHQKMLESRFVKSGWGEANLPRVAPARPGLLLKRGKMTLRKYQALNV